MGLGFTGIILYWCWVFSVMVGTGIGSILMYCKNNCSTGILLMWGVFLSGRCKPGGEYTPA